MRHICGCVCARAYVIDTGLYLRLLFNYLAYDTSWCATANGKGGGAVHNPPLLPACFASRAAHVVRVEFFLSAAACTIGVVKRVTFAVTKMLLLLILTVLFVSHFF